ncbi:phage portal protein [Paraburkholderia atlantica]|uniref:phage portal protein n=1 Tax=Paraburkholderia atlantica TaxID=2654982 RepID=UPI000373F722|nr:phage portal protein [Paraburkholderia atlantica]
MLARVKAAFVNAISSPTGTLVSPSYQSFFARFFGGSSASGAIVSTDTALQVATVWRCVNLIASTIATLPINVYQEMGNGRRLAKEHPLQSLLHSEPNNEQTAVEFFEFLLLSLLFAGNAYVWKQWNSGVGGSRRILNLIPLVPMRVFVQRQLDNSLTYNYVDWNGMAHNGLTGDDILHIKGPSLDGMLGLSPLSYAREVIGTAIAANTSGATIFKNGMRLSGVLQSDQILTPKQREDIRASINSFAGAGNSGGVMALEAGFKYQQMSLSPADAQLLQSQNFNVEEICRWFGVPPHMVGSTSNSTSWGTGLEQQTLGFLTYCLRPWIARLEDSIKRSCFNEAEKAKGYYCEFSVDGLLRTDSAARSAYYSQMTQNGIYTRDEVRRMENLPPKGGNADVLTVQTALSPIDKLGQQAAGVKPGAAPSSANPDTPAGGGNPDDNLGNPASGGIYGTLGPGGGALPPGPATPNGSPQSSI